MRRALVAALLLVVASNVLILGGAWYNRHGQPSGKLWLSDRELPLRRHRRDENSALILPLQWRVADTDSRQGSTFAAATLQRTRQVRGGESNRRVDEPQPR